jgi:hypothetical protein
MGIQTMNPFKAYLGKRKQLFEIQDFSWCPDAVRDGVTDYLRFSLTLVPLYKTAGVWIHKMAKSHKGNWIDLCAGAGGGSLPLFQTMKFEQKLELILTDLYPNSSNLKIPSVMFHPVSVDARQVPASLKGFRTLFTSFHHLPDEVAQGVLQDAFKTKTPIGVFEFTERNLYCLMMTAPTILNTFLLTPFIFPWKLSRLFWTYLIPLIPIVATVDILLSCFRTRTPKELEAMISEMNDPDYTWHVGKSPASFGFSMTYLVGLPKGKDE